MLAFSSQMQSGFVKLNSVAGRKYSKYKIKLVSKIILWPYTIFNWKLSLIDNI